MRLAGLALLLGLGACGTQPPAQTNTAASGYASDLAACEASAASAVNTRNAKTAPAWFGSPILRWGQIADARQACMTARGYGRVRWCSAEELRQGARSGNVVVTPSGVQCAGPPAPERRPPAT